MITGGVVDTAEAIEQVAAEIREPGGEQPVQFKMVEKAVAACSLVDPDAPTTLIVPGNMTEVSALIRSAMKNGAINPSRRRDRLAPTQARSGALALL